MDKGIYCLVFRNPACTVRIGALGETDFRKGWHIYVGSALGSGGLVRLDRHITLSQNKDKQPKWHVDYLSIHHAFRMRYAVFAVTTQQLECRVAGALGGAEVSGFGCSDCDCTSHLFYRERDPEIEIHDAFGLFELTPVTKTIKNP
jgi:Uri superfamily endonuclease